MKVWQRGSARESEEYIAYVLLARGTPRFPEGVCVRTDISGGVLSEDRKAFSKRQLEFRVASRHTPRDALARERVPWRERPVASRRSSFAGTNARAAVATRIASHEAIVSLCRALARDARTARAVRRARYLAGVGHKKAHLSNAEATHRDDRRGVDTRGRGSVAGSRPDPSPSPCG